MANHSRSEKIDDISTRKTVSLIRSLPLLTCKAKKWEYGHSDAWNSEETLASVTTEIQVKYAYGNSLQKNMGKTSRKAQSPQTLIVPEEALQNRIFNTKETLLQYVWWIARGNLYPTPEADEIYLRGGVSLTFVRFPHWPNTGYN